MKNFLNKYPFTAIVGQEQLKKALILNLIDDTIGGVLIVGEKGVSKSTIVRSLENISSKNVITIPLNITEDMLSGVIDIEKTIKEGKMIRELGILEKAKNNILYIDEVNLLNDRIVNILLEATENSETMLIGTMNEEEGDLRSEFLDRFPMYVEVRASDDEKLRIEILKRVLEYENNKLEFISKYKNAEEEILKTAIKAKEFLHKVKIGNLIETIAKICLDYGVIGHRADLYIRKVAIVICALNFRENVIEEDILEAASYVLPHRLTKYPDDKEEAREEEKDQSEQENEDNEDEEGQEQDEEQEAHDEKDEKTSNEDKEKLDSNLNERQSEKEEDRNKSEGNGNDKIFEIGTEFKLKEFLLDKDKKKRKGGGKRLSTASKDKRGRYVKSSNRVNGNDIALSETIRYAAPYQVKREKNGMAIKIVKDDIRGKVRKRKSSSFIVFLVDSSGSLGVNRRMVEVKGAILSILKDSYVKRDYVSLVVARGQDAEVILPKTNSVERGYKLLKEIKTGGKTPLNAGLLKGLDLIKKEMRYDDSIKPIFVIISDGKGNVAINKGMKPKDEMLKIGEEIKRNKDIKTVVIDVEKKGMLSFNLAKKLNESLGGEYIHIENLKKNDILNSVNKVRN